MRRKTLPPLVPLVPVAEYVRMSDEKQVYSIANQQDVHRDFAARHGFEVVKTYPDSGKSGVVARNRKGLDELLSDVTSGKANYKAILVYDVSRWGRYPNNDEAAYYEFLCARAGIPLHYCAEQFVNDGTAISAILKSLKRSMASEFSRELGEKTIRGKNRLVQLGFWVGGKPGYGYRRQLVSADGKVKQFLKSGEYKNIKDDRIILVPGPPEEIDCIRHMFSMALEGNGCSSIASHLNQSGITHSGSPWTKGAVRNILTNPKYTGCNVWRRTSKRLGDKVTRVEAQRWIMKQGAFAPVVDHDTFSRTPEALPRPRRWSDEAILRRVLRLLKAKGQLSWRILQKASGMPGLTTIRAHFGGYHWLYEQVGYEVSPDIAFIRDQLRRSLRLRREMIDRIKSLFPGKIAVTCLPNRRRSMLLIDGQIMVSVLLCGPRRKRGKLFWEVAPPPAEREYITLLCLMNGAHDRTVGHFVFPRMNGFKLHCLVRHDPFLRAGVRLSNLSEFYTTIKKVWDERSNAVC
jgi:DNA invertase Pin-like site-specific DNA recombinase